MEDLRLNMNALEHLGEWAEGGLPALRALAVHDNHLARLPAAVGQCTALQSLTAHANRLGGLPADLRQLTALSHARG